VLPTLLTLVLTKLRKTTERAIEWLAKGNYKILFLALDTTEQKKQSLDYEGQIEAINRLNIKAEFAPDGKFINCNELFIDTLKYTRNELEEIRSELKNISDKLSDLEKIIRELK